MFSVVDAVFCCLVYKIQVFIMDRGHCSCIVTTSVDTSRIDWNCCSIELEKNQVNCTVVDSVYC